MSNTDDMLLDQPWTANNVPGATFSGGMLRFVVDGRCAAPPCFGFLSPLWNGMKHPGALKMGRDGILPANTINAGTYRSVSIRMQISEPLSSAAIFWSRGPSANDGTQQGSMPVSLTGDGRWRTYTFPLVNTAALGKPLAWSGFMNGLRIALNARAGTRPSVKIDWIRLYEPGTSGAVPRAAGESLYTKGYGTCEPIVGPENNDLSALPPGTYDFYAGPTCATPLTVAPVSVVSRPIPIVTAPNQGGGADYATSVLKNPWDLAGPVDVVRTGNICGKTFSKPTGAFSGANCKIRFTGYINDPFVDLHVGTGSSAINSAKYHRLTVTFTYDGAFSLNSGCRGGTIGRVMWQDTRYNVRNGNLPRQTKSWVTYKDRLIFFFDLAAPQSQLNAGPAGTQTPFVQPAGHFVTHLRWDPNEDTCARGFHLHDVKLRADHTPTGGVFGITWRDPRAAAGDTVSIFVRRPGSAFTEIASGLRNSSTGARYSWDTRGRAPGAYDVLVRVFRNGSGANFGDFLATGPVRI
jgi:hypothetical protein